MKIPKAVEAGFCGYFVRQEEVIQKIPLINGATFRFWQQENHPIELMSNKFIDQKIAYIHENPVKAGLVDEPWEYRYSSARDYMNNQKGLLEVELL